MRGGSISRLRPEGATHTDKTVRHKCQKFAQVRGPNIKQIGQVTNNTRSIAAVSLLLSAV